MSGYDFFGESVTPGMPPEVARPLCLTMSLLRDTSDDLAEEFTKACGRVVCLPLDYKLSTMATAMDPKFWENINEKILAHEEKLQDSRIDIPSLESIMGSFQEDQESVRELGKIVSENKELFATVGDLVGKAFGDLQKEMEKLTTSFNEVVQAHDQEDHRWRPPSDGSFPEVVRAKEDFAKWEPTTMLQRDVKKVIDHLPE